MTTPEPSDDQIQEYVQTPWAYEAELAALGERVVDPLIAQFPEKYGYAAAAALGDIGLKLPRVIAALKDGVSSGGGLAIACCLSLMRLEEVEFLFELVESNREREAAVGAILKPLQSYDGARLDYGPAERLCRIGDGVPDIVRTQLAPGTQVCDVTPDDLPEALRGAKSDVDVVRERAVRMLASKGFRKVVKEILPVLAEALSDQTAEVRKWALLSLQEWGAKSRPFHDQMKSLTDDPDKDVRDTARTVFSGLE